MKILPALAARSDARGAPWRRFGLGRIEGAARAQPVDVVAIKFLARCQRIARQGT